MIGSLLLVTIMAYSTSMASRNLATADNIKAMPAEEQDSSSKTIDVSVTSSSQTSPGFFLVHQNYPNPFNGSTTVEYNLPSQSGVYIAIFDVLGRRVRLMANEIQYEGHHIITWNGVDDRGREMSSGVYVWMITADDAFTTMKTLYIK